MGKISRRDHGIDLLETLAIFFVLAYHCSFYDFNFIGNKLPIYYFRYFFRTILSTCVPLFFFANGFLVFHRKFDLKKHVKKILRFMLLAVVWGILTIVILMFIRGDYLSSKEILRILWRWQGGWIGHLWFLGAFVSYYLIFPLLKIVFDYNRRVFLYFVVVCGIFTFGRIFINNIWDVCVTQIIHSAATSRDIDLLGIFNIFDPFRAPYYYAVVYSCIGGLVYEYKDQLMSVPVKKRNIYALLAIVLSCTFLWLLGMSYSKVNGAVWDVVWDGYDTVPTLVNVLALYVLALNFNHRNVVIETVSKNTLGIYLIHEIILDILGPMVMSHSSLRTLWFNIIFTIVFVLLCTLVAEFIKRIPIVKHLLI